MTTIFAALNAVMRDVQGVRKGEWNRTPGASFQFRGIDAVTNAVGPALREHGVIVAPRVIESHYGTVVVGKNKTEMGHCRLLIEFTWYGPEGDSLTTVTAGESFDSGDKATAKAHSVAFRTAMIQTLCLPTDEPDPDEQTYQRAAPAEPPRTRSYDEMVGAIQDATDKDTLRDLWRDSKTLLGEERETVQKLINARLEDLKKAGEGA